MVLYRHIPLGHVLDLHCLQAALRVQPGRCPVCRAIDKLPPIEIFNTGDEASDTAPATSSLPTHSPQSRRSTKTASLSLFRQRIASLQEELEDLQESNDRLRADLEDQRRVVISADTERQRYERKYRDHKKQTAPLAKQFEDARSRAEALFLANAELDVTLRAQEKTLTKANSALDASTEELEDLRAVVARYKSKDRKVSIMSTLSTKAMLFNS